MLMKLKKKNDFIIAVLCTILLALTSVAMTYFFRNATNSRYSVLLDTFKKGDIAEQSIYITSSVDILDKDATLEAKQNASKAVLPVFSFNSLSTIKALSSFESFRTNLEYRYYDDVGKIINSDVLKSLEEEDTLEVVGIAYDVLKEVLIQGYFDSSEIALVEKDNYSKISIINNYLDAVPLNGESTIEIQDIISSENIDRYIFDSIAGLKLGYDEIYVIEYLVKHFLEFNVKYDEYSTQIRRQQAYEKCENVVISFTKGDEVISKDHVITQKNLDDLELLNTSVDIRLGNLLRDFLFEILLLPFAVWIIILCFDRPTSFIKLFLTIVFSAVFSCALLAGLSVFMQRMGLEIQIAYYPVFLVPLLAVMLTGKKNLGYSTTLLMALLISRLPSVSVAETVFFAALSITNCYFLRFLNKRLDMFIQWILSILSGLLLSLIYYVVANTENVFLLAFIFGLSSNLTITFFILAVLVPIIEKVLRLSTPYMLHELAYSVSPVLTRLSQVAPGTYSHSYAVADLAENAAKTIGANALMCRVGAIYHDIGKIEHPEYFVENQQGENKHDNINPTLSAAVIKNHIKVGAQRGREMGLPEEIIEMIEGHHGNDTIAYFYNEALKLNPDAKESDFMYDSEIPSTKECGILMLADAVEAASRTVTPNPQKYNKLINGIILGKIERAQLNKSKLSLTELNEIRNAFIRVLLAKNHSRIEYPDQEED